MKIYVYTEPLLGARNGWLYIHIYVYMYMYMYFKTLGETTKSTVGKLFYII
jgi:hypothetical protein